MAVRARKIPSNQAILGMKLAADVFSPNGSVILNKGEVLTVTALHRLRSHGVEHISILEGKEDPPAHQNLNPDDIKQFSAAYQAKSKQVGETLQQISGGKKVNSDELFGFTQDVLQSVTHPDEIIKFLYAFNLKETTIFHHSINVSVLSNMFARWLGFSAEKAKELSIAALLHDIGKTLPNYHEDQHYTSHPLLGFQIMQEHPVSESVRLGVLLHHENQDGSGFPSQAKWNEIHEYARIIAIADYYDHKTTGGKTLQQKLNPYEILHLLESERFTRFDISYVNTIMKKMAHYYQDSWVRLSDGREAKVVFINDYALASPIVETEGQIINLYQSEGLRITAILE